MGAPHQLARGDPKEESESRISPWWVWGDAGGRCALGWPGGWHWACQPVGSLPRPVPRWRPKCLEPESPMWRGGSVAPAEAIRGPRGEGAAKTRLPRPASSPPSGEEPGKFPNGPASFFSPRGQQRYILRRGKLTGASGGGVTRAAGPARCTGSRVGVAGGGLQQGREAAPASSSRAPAAGSRPHPTPGRPGTPQSPPSPRGARPGGPSLCAHPALPAPSPRRQRLQGNQAAAAEVNLPEGRGDRRERGGEERSRGAPTLQLLPQPGGSPTANETSSASA